MSYFISGHIFLAEVKWDNTLVRKRIMEITSKYDLFALLNEEIKDNRDISDVLNEQRSSSTKSILFVITKSKHDSSSDSLIYPIEYFPDTEKMNHHILDSLSKLSSFLNELLEQEFCKEVTFYISLGYDKTFKKIETSVSKLKETLFNEYNPFKEMWPSLEVRLIT